MNFFKDHRGLCSRTPAFLNAIGVNVRLRNDGMELAGDWRFDISLHRSGFTAEARRHRGVLAECLLQRKRTQIRLHRDYGSLWEIIGRRSHTTIEVFDLCCALLRYSNQAQGAKLFVISCHGVFHFAGCVSIHHPSSLRCHQVRPILWGEIVSGIFVTLLQIRIGVFEDLDKALPSLNLRPIAIFLILCARRYSPEDHESKR